VAVDLKRVERGDGHGASLPVARLEDGLDALAAVAGHDLPVEDADATGQRISRSQARSSEYRHAGVEDARPMVSDPRSATALQVVAALPPPRLIEPCRSSIERRPRHTPYTRPRPCQLLAAVGMARTTEQQQARLVPE
jgi:hypothetical protein